MADPRGEFDDLGFTKSYESVSTLVIVANKGPIILMGNTFTENIGTVGGAVHIMSPDFESNPLDFDPDYDTVDYKVNHYLPYIFIEDNNF